MNAYQKVSQMEMENAKAKVNKEMLVTEDRKHAGKFQLLPLSL